MSQGKETTRVSTSAKPGQGGYDPQPVYTEEDDARDQELCEPGEKQEEGEDEAEEIGDDEKADLAARQAEQEVLDPEIAVDAAEDQAEDGRADQDEDDEGGRLTPP